MHLGGNRCAISYMASTVFGFFLGFTNTGLSMAGFLCLWTGRGEGGGKGTNRVESKAKKAETEFRSLSANSSANF